MLDQVQAKTASEAATALLIGLARSSAGVTATSAARALYDVQTPTAQQRQGALNALRALAAAGHLLSGRKPNRRVVNLEADDVPSCYLRGGDRTASRAIANADRYRKRAGHRC